MIGFRGVERPAGHIGDPRCQGPWQGLGGVHRPAQPNPQEHAALRTIHLGTGGQHGAQSIDHGVAADAVGTGHAGDVSIQVAVSQIVSDRQLVGDRRLQTDGLLADLQSAQNVAFGT